MEIFYLPAKSERKFGLNMSRKKYFKADSSNTGLEKLTSLKLGWVVSKFSTPPGYRPDAFVSRCLVCNFETYLENSSSESFTKCQKCPCKTCFTVTFLYIRVVGCGLQRWTLELVILAGHLESVYALTPPTNFTKCSKDDARNSFVTYRSKIWQVLFWNSAYKGSWCEPLDPIRTDWFPFLKPSTKILSSYNSTVYNITYQSHCCSFHFWGGLFRTLMIRNISLCFKFKDDLRTVHIKRRMTSEFPFSGQNERK